MSVWAIAFMVLQLIPISGLNGLHFETESYYMLIIWIVLGAVFYLFRGKRFDTAPQE